MWVCVYICEGGWMIGMVQGRRGKGKRGTGDPDLSVPVCAPVCFPVPLVSLPLLLLLPILIRSSIVYTRYFIYSSLTPFIHSLLSLAHSLTHSLSLSHSRSAVLSLVTIKKLECLKQVLLLECWPLHIAVWNNRLDLCLSAGHTPGLRFAGCAARGSDRGCPQVQGV